MLQQLNGIEHFSLQEFKLAICHENQALGHVGITRQTEQLMREGLGSDDVGFNGTGILKPVSKVAASLVVDVAKLGLGLGGIVVNKGRAERERGEI